MSKIGAIGKIIEKLASRLKIKIDSLKSSEVIKHESSNFTAETKTNNTKRIKK